MAVLILGLVIFLGAHSVRIVADGWRSTQLARLGERRWKGLYSVVALIGFVLIVWGYGLARREAVVLWHPPLWAPHLAALLTALAFILFPAAHIPANHFKAALGHPMVIGVLLWACAHLIANGTLNAIVLFGAFLLWALLDLRQSRRRDRLAGIVYPAGTLANDLKAVVGGLLAWALFAFVLHGWLIGVRPLG